MAKVAKLYTVQNAPYAGKKLLINFAFHNPSFFTDAEPNLIKLDMPDISSFNVSGIVRVEFPDGESFSNDFPMPTIPVPFTRRNGVPFSGGFVLTQFSYIYAMSDSMSSNVTIVTQAFGAKGRAQYDIYECSMTMQELVDAIVTPN